MTPDANRPEQDLNRELQELLRESIRVSIEQQKQFLKALPGKRERPWLSFALGVISVYAVMGLAFLLSRMP